MPQYLPTVDELLPAFIKFRDSLPSDHERRIRFAEFNSLRYDTLNPDVVLIFSPLENFPLVRRVRGNTTEEIARNIVLFPKHTCIWCGDDSGILLQMSERRRKKDHIVDILRVDYPPRVGTNGKPSSYVIIQTTHEDINAFDNRIILYNTKKTDYDRYLAVKTFTSFAGIFKNMTILESTEFELNFHLKQSFIDKVTQALKEHPAVKENIDQLLNTLKDPQLKNIVNEDAEFKKLNLRDMKDTDMLLMGDYIVNVLNIVFPGYWTPLNNIVKEVYIRYSDQAGAFKNVFAYCTL